MKRYFKAIVVSGLLCLHAALLAWTATHNSVTEDEVGHLPAGLYIWQFGRFDLYRVNPPLTRMLAALPVAIAAPASDWRHCAQGLLARPEWLVGQDFIAANRELWFNYFVLARCALFPLSLLGAFFCYRWASELYGDWSGIAALALWCFSPNMIAHGATIGADGGAAALGVIAGYAFWRWLGAANWTNALVAGAALGLANLAKSQWIVLFGLWPLLWLCLRRPAARVATVQQLLAIMIVGLFSLNLGYGFQGSLSPLGEYQFASRTLSGRVSGCGNRFAETWAAHFPVPLPKDYLTGLDLQKVDFENGAGSYLNGEWRKSGFWYYYVYAALVKMPLGTLLLLALALTIRPIETPRFSSAEIVLLSSALSVFALVSCESGAVQYFRYVLPTVPFIFIFASRVVSPRVAPCAGLRFAAAGLAAYAAVSSMATFPYCMSYFNELAGGSAGGAHHLIGTDIDAGQDAWRLKDWADLHSDARPLYTALMGTVAPSHYGIDCRSLVGSARGVPGVAAPGWYAISVNYLHQPGGMFSRFLDLRPVASIGHTTLVYHVARANAAPREGAIAPSRIAAPVAPRVQMPANERLVAEARAAIAARSVGALAIAIQKCERRFRDIDVELREARRSMAPWAVGCPAGSCKSAVRRYVVQGSRFYARCDTLETTAQAVASRKGRLLTFDGFTTREIRLEDGALALEAIGRSESAMRMASETPRPHVLLLTSIAPGVSLSDWLRGAKSLRNIDTDLVGGMPAIGIELIQSTGDTIHLWLATDAYLIPAKLMVYGERPSDCDLRFSSECSQWAAAEGGVLAPRRARLNRFAALTSAGTRPEIDETIELEIRRLTLAPARADKLFASVPAPDGVPYRMVRDGLLTERRNGPRADAVQTDGWDSLTQLEKMLLVNNALLGLYVGYAVFAKFRLHLQKYRSAGDA